MNIYMQLMLKQVLPEEINMKVEEAGQQEEEDRQLYNFRCKTHREQGLSWLGREMLHFTYASKFTGLSPNSQLPDWLMVSGGWVRSGEGRWWGNKNKHPGASGCLHLLTRWPQQSKGSG